MLRCGTFLSKCNQRFIDLIDVITSKAERLEKLYVHVVLFGKSMNKWLGSISVAVKFRESWIRVSGWRPPISLIIPREQHVSPEASPAFYCPRNARRLIWNDSSLISDAGFYGILLCVYDDSKVHSICCTLILLVLLPGDLFLILSIDCNFSLRCQGASRNYVTR